MEPNSPLFLLFLRPLNRVGIVYMVTGSAAAMVYGEPRLTHDVDIVVEAHLPDIPGFQTMFPKAEFYLPPREVLEDAVRGAGHGHFNVIHLLTGFKADFYLNTGDTLHRWALDNRNEVKVEGESVWLAPPEYVIIRKLQYYQEGGSGKHIQDIGNMLRLSPDRIDLALLKRLAAEQGVERELRAHFNIS